MCIPNSWHPYMRLIDIAPALQVRFSDILIYICLKTNGRKRSHKPSQDVFEIFECIFS